MQVPLDEADGFVVGEELELDVRAVNFWLHLPAMCIVSDRPDQNPVPENLQERTRSESDRTDTTAEDTSVLCVFSGNVTVLYLKTYTQREITAGQQQDC